MAIKWHFHLSSIVCSLLLSSPAECSEVVSSENYLKNVYAHFQINDYTSACEEAFQGIKQYPGNENLWKACLKAYAKAGDEKGMMQVWSQYIVLFPLEKCNREMLECMAWGIIEHGENSSSPIIRSIAVLGAAFSQDAKGITILHRGLQDKNSLIRAIAVQLSGQLHDDKLQKSILTMLDKEKVWKVYLEAVKTAGGMKIAESKPFLMGILAKESSTAEEKAAAIQSLVDIMDTMPRGEIEKLVQSKRAGLRRLACEVIIKFDLLDEIDLIIPLLNDSRAEVRAAALQVFGILRIAQHQGNPILDIVTSKLKDPDVSVAITAAWVLTLNDSFLGQVAFEPYFRNDSPDVRRQAAAALASCGRYGFPLIDNVFKETQDPFVKMNLALGMIGQKVSTELACEALYKGLNQEKGRWMWEEFGCFRALAPSKLKHDEDVPQYPEAKNQMTRLEILNILAIMKYPKCQDAIKRFLQEKSWGVSGVASALLLTEGDEEALELVENLMEEDDQKIAVQAALVLAQWGRGEKALSTLEKAYFSADREMKEKILEGMLRVGSPISIPFLTERLKDTSQSIRLIAAAGLLLCLYN